MFVSVFVSPVCECPPSPPAHLPFQEEMSGAETRLLNRLGWEGSGLITSVGFEG